DPICNARRYRWGLTPFVTAGSVLGMDVSGWSSARRVTKQIRVGAVPVGGDAPMTVQSMTTTKTADVEGTLQQIYALAAAGCDIVRCTCNEAEAAEGLAQIVPRSPIPVIADIHHQYKMA